MQIRKWLQLRREALKSLRWLHPVLLVVDVIFLGVGYIASPGLGLALGALGLIANELFSPVIAARIFIKELHAELSMSGSLETKVIRKQSDNTQT